MKKMVELLTNQGIEISVNDSVITIELIRWSTFKEEFPEVANDLEAAPSYMNAGMRFFTFDGYTVAIKK